MHRSSYRSRFVNVQAVNDKLTGVVRQIQESTALKVAELTSRAAQEQMQRMEALVSDVASSYQARAEDMGEAIKAAQQAIAQRDTALDLAESKSAELGATQELLAARTQENQAFQARVAELEGAVQAALQSTGEFENILSRFRKTEELNDQYRQAFQIAKGRIEHLERLAEDRAARIRDLERQLTDRGQSPPASASPGGDVAEGSGGGPDQLAAEERSNYESLVAELEAKVVAATDAYLRIQEERDEALSICEKYERILHVMERQQEQQLAQMHMHQQLAGQSAAPQQSTGQQQQKEEEDLEEEEEEEEEEDGREGQGEGGEDDQLDPAEMLADIRALMSHPLASQLDAGSLEMLAGLASQLNSLRDTKAALEAELAEALEEQQGSQRRMESMAEQAAAMQRLEDRVMATLSQPVEVREQRPQGEADEEEEEEEDQAVPAARPFVLSPGKVAVPSAYMRDAMSPPNGSPSRPRQPLRPRESPGASTRELEQENASLREALQEAKSGHDQLKSVVLQHVNGLRGELDTVRQVGAAPLCSPLLCPCLMSWTRPG